MLILRMKPKKKMTAATLFPLKKQRQEDTPIELQIKAWRLPEPETEYHFAASLGRKWAADYAWPEWKILFEVEGGGFGNAVHVGTGAYQNKTKKINGEKVVERIEIPEGTIIRVGGGHNTGPGLEKDIEKYNCAAVLGWTVIRASTRQIRDGAAIKWLVDAFKAKFWKEPEGFQAPVIARPTKEASTQDF